MGFAELIKGFIVSEVFNDEVDEGDYEKFEKGSIVEVIKEVTPSRNDRLYIIYSPVLNESTVVAERFLKFIKKQD